MDWWHKQQKFVFLQHWRLKSPRLKCQTIQFPDGNLLPAFFLCQCVRKSTSSLLSLKGSNSIRQAWASWLHLTLITLNTFTLGIKTSTYDFGGDANIESKAHNLFPCHGDWEPSYFRWYRNKMLVPQSAWIYEEPCGAEHSTNVFQNT